MDEEALAVKTGVFGNIQVSHLSWGEETASKFAEELALDHPEKTFEPFDLIIGSEIIYQYEVVVPLLETIKTLLSKKGEVILCCKPRSAPTIAEDELLAKFRATAVSYGFSVTFVKLEEFLSETEVKQYAPLALIRLSFADEDPVAVKDSAPPSV